MGDTTDDSRGPEADPLRDPTAPDWAAPLAAGDEPTDPSQATQAIDPSVTTALPIPPPPPPASPYAAPSANPYAAPPAAPPAPPPGYPFGGQPQTPPPANPYAAGPPPAAPYAANPQPGANPYGTAPPPVNPYANGPGAYPAPSGQPPFAYNQAPTGGTNTSAIVLLVLSGLALLPCCLVPTPAAILAIVALTKQRDDPAGSRRLTKYGWIAFAVAAVLGVIAWTVVIANGIMSGSTSSDGYSY